jgi:hypothetical protein
MTISSNTLLSPARPEPSAPEVEDDGRASPLESSRPGKRVGKRTAALILVLVVALIATVIIVSSRKELPLSTTPPAYKPGPISPSKQSLDAWVFHYAKGIDWKRVGGLQTVFVRISKVDPRWGTWELSARQADPLTGYSYDASNGWKNVHGTPVPPEGFLGPPKDMPANVNHGEWTQISFAMKTNSDDLEIKSKSQTTVNVFGAAR